MMCDRSASGLSVAAPGSRGHAAEIDDSLMLTPISPGAGRLSELSGVLVEPIEYVVMPCIGSPIRRVQPAGYSVVKPPARRGDPVDRRCPVGNATAAIAAAHARLTTATAIATRRLRERRTGTIGLSWMRGGSSVRSPPGGGTLSLTADTRPVSV